MTVRNWLRINKLLINRWDALIAAGFAVFALLIFLGRIQGSYPDVPLEGDASNIAAYAAAWEHPELFKSDALLDNLDNISIYATIHIPLIQWLARLSGNYSMGMLDLLAPHIFLSALGWYILGRVVFKNRFWALLFAVLNCLPLELNLEENWGIYSEPLPRFTFQALLPYLLSLAWLWRGRPSRWPWLMALSGALVYVHPISAPDWALGIWLGLWLYIPESWPVVKRLLVMVGNGLAAGLVSLPFVINYLLYHVQGASPDYDMVTQMIQAFFPRNLLNVPGALADFAMLTAPLIIMGLASLGVVWLVGQERRVELGMVLAWAAGITFVSVIFPWIEHAVENYYRLVPLESELPRGIRYFIPILLLFCIWGLSELHRCLKPVKARQLMPYLGLTGVFITALVIPPYPSLLESAAACLARGRLVCQQPSDLALALQAIRAQTPPGSPIFTSAAINPRDDYGMAIRYQALRPLVFSYKDKTLLIFSNPGGLQQWQDYYQRMRQLRNKDNKDLLMKKYLQYASALNSKYLLVDFILSPEEVSQSGLRLVYSNPSYMLLEIVN